MNTSGQILVLALKVPFFYYKAIFIQSEKRINLRNVIATDKPVVLCV